MTWNIIWFVFYMIDNGVVFSRSIIRKLSSRLDRCFSSFVLKQGDNFKNCYQYSLGSIVECSETFQVLNIYVWILSLTYVMLFSIDADLPQRLSFGCSEFYIRCIYRSCYKCKWDVLDTNHDFWGMYASVIKFVWKLCVHIHMYVNDFILETSK